MKIIVRNIMEYIDNPESGWRSGQFAECGFRSAFPSYLPSY
jgi:hypothetical protein